MPTDPNAIGTPESRNPGAINPNPDPQLNMRPPKAPLQSSPSFQDILDGIKQPIQTPSFTPARGQLQGQELFERGLERFDTSGGIRPETQRILDVLGERTARARKTGVSEAQALASRRGLAGSSIEQFGAQQAGEAAERVGRESEMPILKQEAEFQQRNLELGAQALFERAKQTGDVASQAELQNLLASANAGNVQAQLELDRRISEANLTSDEVASVRNLRFATLQLTIEQDIANRSLEIQRENAGIAKDIADQEARNEIINSSINVLLPILLEQAFPTNT